MLDLITRSGCNVAPADEIDVVQQAQNVLHAVRLIQLGARATLVCQLTGLTRRVVNGLYMPLTGTPARPGQTPFTDTWYLKNTRRLLHTNTVWQLHQQLMQFELGDARLLIHVYETYLQITDPPHFTVSRAHFVPRLVAINMWVEQSCDHCGQRHIGPVKREGSVCPACAVYFKYRCCSCGTAMDTPTAGRWMRLCADCRTQQPRNPGSQQGRTDA